MGSRLRHSTGPKISFFAFQDIITATSGIVILVVLMLAADLGRSPESSAGESHPELKNQLTEMLAQQAQLEVELAQLREMIAVARALPDTRKLAAEVAMLRDRLESLRQKISVLQTEENARNSAVRQQDALLGLADLRSSLDKLKQETLALTERNRTTRSKMQSLEEQVRQAQAKLLLAKSREGQMWLVPDKDNSTKEPVLVQVSNSGLVIERFDKPNERTNFDYDSALDGFQQQLTKFAKANQYFVFLIRPSGIDLFKDASKLARSSGFEVGFDAVEEKQVVHFAAPKPVDWDAPAPATNNAPAKTIAPANVKPGPTTGTGTGVPAPAKPQPLPPPVEKPLSWWQRFLRFIGL